MEGEVQKHIGSLIQKYAEEATQEDTKVDAKLPSKPYFRGARVGYKSERSNDIPPGLSLGREDRKLGLGDKQEPKAPLKVDLRVERDTDSIMAESENDENNPVTEKAPTQGETTEWNKAIGIGMHIWVTVTG